MQTTAQDELRAAGIITSSNIGDGHTSGAPLGKLRAMVEQWREGSWQEVARLPSRLQLFFTCFPPSLQQTTPFDKCKLWMMPPTNSPQHSLVGASLVAACCCTMPYSSQHDLLGASLVTTTFLMFPLCSMCDTNSILTTWLVHLV